MDTALNIHNPSSVARTMQLVLFALIPGTLVYCYLFGWGVLINIALAVFSAALFEALSQHLRKRSPATALADYSAVVTAVLIALCLPPLIPWWIPVLASGFAMLLAKHCFGGIGNNLFNPAMVGYAMVLISFPTELSVWLQQPTGLSISFIESLHAVFHGGVPAIPQWDALTGATALDQHRTMALEKASLSAINQQTVGFFGASYSEWTNLAYLAGGLWLLHKKTINWHIPVSVLVTLLAALLFHKLFSSQPLSVPVNLFGGATMLCAFFISTDPVSAAASARGRLIYGAVTGLLIYIIRVYGAYPDSVAFAVLLANCAVPTIDRLDIWLNRSTDA